MNELDHSLQVVGSLFFAVAVIHTFVANKFLKLSHRYPKGSVAEAFFHLLGEIEVVFGFWAAIFTGVFIAWKGFANVQAHHEALKFTEPIFVFCVMVIASTKPIMLGARNLIQMIGNFLSRVFGIPGVLADIFVVMTLGPLSGSFITEPAAMTVTAMLLISMIKKTDAKLMYALLGVLFVNVSIGGALTPFAAPPILMVVGKWQWDFSFIIQHFGWKSALAVLINALGLVLIFKNKIQDHLQEIKVSSAETHTIPIWVMISHYLILALLVLVSHYENSTMGVFLFFLGLVSVTKQYHSELRLKESLLVAFFLGGIIMFGEFQRWWLAPLLSEMESLHLYFGASALTAITDNAALTYLGSQVEGLSDLSKYYLVAGAIAGGGLTIIANAPNAAGFSILQKRFPDGLNPLRLLLAALLPTLIALFFLGLSVDF